MRRGRTTRLPAAISAGLLAAWAAVVLAPALASGQEAWWNYDWPYRRAATVADMPKTGLPGDEVGLVTMPTGGLIQRDGRDLRVTTHDGQFVPFRVLMIGPGDVVRLAFALRAPGTKYFVYFGNEKLPADPSKLAEALRPQELKIRRGVLMETWAWQGGAIGGFPQVQKAFAAVGNLLGRDFRTHIFLGHNPFGPQDRLCTLYTGALVCPEDGEYAFSTSSQDASFLVIDDQLVHSHGGQHPPHHVAATIDRVRLTKGLHELKLYHATLGGGDPVVTVAWQEPSAKRIWTIPPEAYAPIRVATPGMLERYNAASNADFSFTHAGEAFIGTRYFQRFTFQAMVAGKGTAKPQVQWSFGDGQKSDQLKCDHVFLRDGTYKVTLTADFGGDKVERANQIVVNRPWDQVTENKLDPTAEHARIVVGYDFATADEKDLGPMLLLFKRADMPQAILRAGDALVKRPAASALTLAEAMPIYVEALLQTAKDPARAAAACLKAAEMTPDPAIAADMTTRGGQAALVAKDADKALAAFEQAIRKYSAVTTDPSIRLARIGVGDVWRLRGDYAKAAEGYAAAGVAQKSGVEKEAVRRGDLARHVEDYIHDKQYPDAEEFLDTWETEFPADKLEGYSTLLRVRLAIARKEFTDAAAQAELLARINPRSNYAPELLLLASQAQQSVNNADAARQDLQKIVKDYPESPLSLEAKKRLAGGTASVPASRPASRPTKPPRP